MDEKKPEFVVTFKEYSYIDLLSSLHEAVSTDVLMYGGDRNKAIMLINKLENLLEKYSA